MLIDATRTLRTSRKEISLREEERKTEIEREEGRDREILSGRSSCLSAPVVLPETLVRDAIGSPLIDSGSAKS